MKKITVSAAVCLYLFACCFSVAAQEFKTVRDGIEYAEMTREIDNGSIKMNLLRLDLSKVRLDVVHAMDTAIGTETTSSMAIRHGAFAAINGGFFRLDKSIFAGNETGVLLIDGKLLSESYADRIALAIKNKPDITEVAFAKMKVGTALLFNKQLITSNGFNRQRKENDFVIYTSNFHRNTLTDDNGMEIVVRKNKVFQTFKNKGNAVIPEDGFILPFSGTELKRIQKLPKIGTEIKLLETVFHYIDDPKPTDVYTEDVIGGVPQLIKNGKIQITWEQEDSSESFVRTRHPRTAVAKLKDGKFLMIAIDGRSETSSGIGLENLAKILLELGATDAMNLDGGGSTTMFLDGKVVNKPSDKEGERKVGDAILVTPRKM